MGKDLHLNDEEVEALSVGMEILIDGAIDTLDAHKKDNTNINDLDVGEAAQEFVDLIDLQERRLGSFKSIRDKLGGE